ncbi:hypothetical protein [Zoogloea sp. LCSB751]|uniref:hypothetical protein n=1 Tax=Zoogloea sp. LCSB751 TaxID=1965277 RepID=UPI001C1F24AE|nr:hypothetical protein [Zoogloea sp. LCSB751]
MDGLFLRQKGRIREGKFDVNAGQFAPVFRGLWLNGVKVVGVQYITIAEWTQDVLHVAAEEAWKRDSAAYVPDDGCNGLYGREFLGFFLYNFIILVGLC